MNLRDIGKDEANHSEISAKYLTKVSFVGWVVILPKERGGFCHTIC